MVVDRTCGRSNLELVIMLSLCALPWPSWRSPVGRLLLRAVLWLGIGGMAGGTATAGLIGYLEQTTDHRFEPWMGDDPSYSEDPLRVLGPPLSPLALFPWMWQRHHPGDVVSQHTVEVLEAEVIRSVPPLKAASRGVKLSRLAGPWGTRRKIGETYRELFDKQPESAESAQGGREQPPGEAKQPSTGSGRQRPQAADDDDADDE
jgi:hypothetical protein